MRIIALDLSTHTGYAVFEHAHSPIPHLLSSGTIHLDKSVHEFGRYPKSYRAAAREMARIIHDQIRLATTPVMPDQFVIEEINLGKDRYVQKLLENIHTAVLDMLELHYPQAGIFYLDSMEWRCNLQLQLTKDQKKANAKLSKAKRTAAETGAKLDKKSLGIKGKVTWKHLAVAKANEVYGRNLKMKQNDEADAICLGLAFCNNATRSDGV